METQFKIHGNTHVVKLWQALTRLLTFNCHDVKLSRMYMKTHKLVRIVSSWSCANKKRNSAFVLYYFQNVQYHVHSYTSKKYPNKYIRNWNWKKLKPQKYFFWKLTNQELIIFKKIHFICELERFFKQLFSRVINLDTYIRVCGIQVIFFFLF